MRNLKSAASAALFVLFALFNQTLSAATVTYQYEEWNTGSKVPTGAVLGYLVFNSPPASASTGWTINATQESQLVSFTFNSNVIDLTGLDITSNIVSNTGAELDAGGLTIGLNPPKWLLTFGVTPGIDVVEIPGGGAASVYNGQWKAVVPLPAAAWLFVSGLLGLVAATRQRKVLCWLRK
jgi:hypothetical protein